MFTVLFNRPEDKSTKLYGPYSSEKECELQIEKWTGNIKSTICQNIEIIKDKSFLGGEATIVKGHLGNNWNQEPIKTLANFQIFEMQSLEENGNE